jgi:hypothetical protein
MADVARKAPAARAVLVAGSTRTPFVMERSIARPLSPVGGLTRSVIAPPLIGP